MNIYILCYLGSYKELDESYALYVIEKALGVYGDVTKSEKIDTTGMETDDYEVYHEWIVSVDEMATFKSLLGAFLDVLKALAEKVAFWIYCDDLVSK